MSCNPDPPRLQVNTVLDSWKYLMLRRTVWRVYYFHSDLRTCSDRLLAEHFAAPPSSSFHVPLPSPLLAGPPPYPPVLGDIEGTLPNCLPHQACLSRCLQDSPLNAHRFLAFTMIKSKIITLSHLFRSPPQRRFTHQIAKPEI